MTRSFYNYIILIFLSLHFPIKGGGEGCTLGEIEEVGPGWGGGGGVERLYTVP